MDDCFQLKDAVAKCESTNEDFIDFLKFVKGIKFKRNEIKGSLKSTSLALDLEELIEKSKVYEDFIGARENFFSLCNVTKGSNYDQVLRCLDNCFELIRLNSENILEALMQCGEYSLRSNFSVLFTLALRAKRSFDCFYEELKETVFVGSFENISPAKEFNEKFRDDFGIDTLFETSNDLPLEIESVENIFPAKDFIENFKDDFGIDTLFETSNDLPLEIESRAILAIGKSLHDGIPARGRKNCYENFKIAAEDHSSNVLKFNDFASMMQNILCFGKFRKDLPNLWFHFRNILRFYVLCI